jgi:hypothetical protein
MATLWLQNLSAENLSAAESHAACPVPQLQAVIVVFATAVNFNLGLITPFRKRASIVRSKQRNISQWKTLVTSMSDTKTRADVCE